MEIANSVSPECARLDRHLNLLLRYQKDEIIRNQLWIGDKHSVPLGNVHGVINCKQVPEIANNCKQVPEIANNCKQLDVFVEDVETADIASYFDQTGEFIHSRISNNEGVLVCSDAGVSRSATICMAYLIKYHDMSVIQARAYVKNARDVICPNDGFIQQLVEYAKK